MSIQCKTEEIIVDNGEYNSDEADDSIRLTLEDSGGESYHPNYHSDQHSSSRQRIQHISSGHHLVATSGKNSTKNIMENEKRMRREIANSNERRRMQSINAGFQSLRSLLPHHEGEKLSKAAILQQTAQYIIDLEREKTHLLSQNSQLKRHLGQHELGNQGSGGGGGNSGGGEITNAGAIKKRKLTDNIITIQTISDSSDEGLGSMSPEPVTLLTSATKTGQYLGNNTKEITEIRSRLEAERKRRMIVEDRLRQLEREMYPNQFIQREVIEHTDNVREEEIDVSLMNDPLKLQVVEINELPAVGQTQVVVCSSLEDMQDMQVIQDMQDMQDMQDDESGTLTEEIHDDIREEVIIKEESPEYVEVPSRLQPILEAAIKAEPKVEVERINATLTKIKDDSNTKDGIKQGNSRMYLTSTSRQNLETIVEAIRHLEGDHLFGDMVEQKKAQQQKQLAQDVPLALTNKPLTLQRKQLPVELSPFLQLKKPTTTVTTVTTIAALQNATNNSSNSSNNSNNSNSIMGTSSNSSSNISSSNTTTTVVGSSILKAQLQPSSLSTSSVATGAATVVALTSSSSTTSSSLPSLTTSSTTGVVQQQSTTPTSSATITIAATLKQCRPGVIVGKQISS